MAPEARDSLDKDGQQALLLAQAEQIRLLLEQNVALTARVAELEARLNVPPKTPSNSSLPPSTGRKPNRPDGKGKRRRGRPGVARALYPKPDHVREIYAERCCCGACLSPADQPDVTAYDHIDLPVIRPVTTRIHLHKGHCPRCRKPVAAKPPADMPPKSPFGAGITATVTHLHASQMVSYSRTEMMGGLFGLTMSEGALANMLRRAARPFADEADTIAETVPDQQAGGVPARLQHHPNAAGPAQYQVRPSARLASMRSCQANIFNSTLRTRGRRARTRLASHRAT